MTGLIMTSSLVLTVLLVLVLASVLFDAYKEQVKRRKPVLSLDESLSMRESIESVLVRDGWEAPSGARPVFTRETEDALITLRYVSFGPHGPSLFEVEIEHLTAPAPASTILDITADTTFFHTHQEAGVELHIAPGAVTATLRHDQIKLTGPALPLMLQCFQLEALKQIPQTTSLSLSHFSMCGSGVSLQIRTTPAKPSSIGLRGVAPPLGETIRTHSLLAHRLARATRWRGVQGLAFFEGVLDAPATSLGLRMQVREQLIAAVPDDEQPSWWAARCMNPESNTLERGYAFQVLFNRHPTDRAAIEIVERLLEPAEVDLRGLMLQNAPDYVAEQLQGENALRWFSVIFDEYAGVDPQTLRQICEDLDPMLLLDDALSARARSVLLVNLLRVRDPKALEVPLRELIRRADEEELVEMLNGLQMNRSKPVASLVAHLASHPENVDKVHEYLALLGAIRTFSRDFPEAFEQPGVDAFLCDCITHQDERVASMAPPLLELTGGEEALGKLTALMGRPSDLKIPAAALGRAIQAIRSRLGKGVFEGALTLTVGHEGGLTVASGEAGALTSVEAEDRGA